jgi:hypothetical protein
MGVGIVIAIIVGSLSLLILSCWCFMRRAAYTAAADDTRTICGISRLGTVCKIAHVCGHPTPELEKTRFSFFPAGHIDVNDPRSGGITELKDIIPNSSTLVVAFSGGATNKIGLPRLEFRRMLANTTSPTTNVDQLYVLDPTGMSFYEHQIEKFSNQLRFFLLPYKKVVLLGNCMGATAALRFSALLQNKEDVVLAFNPEVKPNIDPRLSFRIASCLSPSKTSRLSSVLNKAISTSPGRIRIHMSNWPPEYEQSMLLLSENDDILDVDFDIGDGGDDSIASSGVSLGVGKKSDHSTLPRIVRILHREFKIHGLISKQLKSSGSLRKILDDAVMV